MLEALHGAGAEDVLIVNFRDRRLVEAAQQAGVGNSMIAEFRGDNWDRDGDSNYVATAEVLGLHDGHLIGRRGIVAGKNLYAGPMTLLDLGGVQVVVRSRSPTTNTSNPTTCSSSIPQGELPQCSTVCPSLAYLDPSTP